MVRPATLADYRWLYANGYMPDGLKCARDVMADIVDRCPASFFDYGCGRGDLVRWINEKTRGSANGYDAAYGGAEWGGQFVDYALCFDVLEHLNEADAIRFAFSAK